MSTASTRRTLVALTITTVLLPAAPALAQTGTPLPTATPTPAPTQFLDGFEVSRPVIDFGQTVDVTVRGAVGTEVSLFLADQRTPEPRLIRTGTIGADRSVTWTGLEPEDTSVFFARAPLIRVSTAPVTVRVRRDVTIGVSQANGVYTFRGRLQRAEAGVQVTIARLDSETGRVTGVASTTTDAAGRYTVRTALPQGFAGYYALTEAENGLDAGRSRLYGLIVNTQPSAPSPTPAPQTISLDVGLSSGRTYVFSGRVTNGADVPVTLARIDDGRLVGVAGGRTAADGSYVFRVPVTGTSSYQVLTASAQSRVYGLAVPRPVGFE